MNKRFIAAVLGAAALAIPAAAVANPGHGKGHDKKAAKEVAKGKGKGKGKKAKTVTFVFRGTFTAPGTVEVLSGNAHVRKGGFVGQQVEFDFAGAKVVVADTNADQAVDINDVKDGDVVLVQARILKGTQHAVAAEAGADAGAEADAVVAARKLIDETNAPVESDPEPEAAPVS